MGLTFKHGMEQLYNQFLPRRMNKSDDHNALKLTKSIIAYVIQ